MKIPNKLKIQGRYIAVNWIDDKVDSNLNGDYRSWREEIRLNEQIRLTEGKAERIFLEEVFHAVIKEVGQQNEWREEQVQAIISVLYATLKENNLLS